ncbi:MAG: hypothetical protein ACK5XN_12290, partial [Bacteroidota bacterium]
YVFQPQPNHPVFVHDPSKEEARTEHDTFYSREKVAEFTARLLDTLATSPSRDVRLHLELVRIALRDAKAMTNEALARHYRLTRAAVNLRVQKLRRALTGPKESFLGGGKPRVAPHRGQKTRVSAGERRGACK